MFGQAAAGGTEDPRAMGVVDHQNRLVTVAKFAQSRQIGAVAVHGKNRVGDDQSAPVTAGPFQQAPQFAQVAVRVGANRRATGPGRVDQRSMVEFVHHDQVVRSGQGGECGEVGHVAGWQQQRRFGFFESRKTTLQIQMENMMAPEQSAGAAADAVTAGRLTHRFDQCRLGRQTEVVVAGEIGQLPTVANQQRPRRFGNPQGSQHVLGMAPIQSLLKLVKPVAHPTS